MHCVRTRLFKNGDRVVVGDHTEYFIRYDLTDHIFPLVFKDRRTGVIQNRPHSGAPTVELKTWDLTEFINNKDEVNVITDYGSRIEVLTLDDDYQWFRIREEGTKAFRKFNPITGTLWGGKTKLLLMRYLHE